MTLKQTLKLMRLVSYIISFAYIGVLLFFFMGETLHAINTGTPQNWDMKSVLILSTLGLYCLSLLIAIKWEISFGAISLLLIASLNTFCHTWHVAFYSMGITAPVLYITSGVLSRYKAINLNRESADASSPNHIA